MKNESMVMKEMVYKDVYMSECREKEVLFSGIYKGRKFSIVSLESHPVAYVSMKDTEPKDYDNEYYWEVDVHGGFTYCGKSYWDDDKENMYLGWDYAHAGDCWGGFSKYGIRGKKWTTEEIYEELKNVIIQLNRMWFLDNHNNEDFDLSPKEVSKLINENEELKKTVEILRQNNTALMEYIKQRNSIPDSIWFKENVKNKFVMSGGNTDGDYEEEIIYCNQFN